MRRKFILLLAALAAAAGCRPYDKPVFVECGTSTTPFLVRLEGDLKQATVETEELVRERMIGSRRIQISYRWQREGRWFMPWAGKYMPNERVVFVDRSPESREWTAESKTGTDAKDQALWAESADSVGFSCGIMITARIPTDDDAVKFLFNYPAGKEEVIPSQAWGKDNYVVKKVCLADIMDTEMRTRCQQVLSKKGAAEKMDALRGKQNEIRDAMEEDLRTFYKSRGVDVTAVALRGGMTYENPAIQTAIDRVFQAQQDKSVAMAEAEAARERKLALKLAGEGLAEQAIEKARGESEAIQMIADAKKYELEKLQDNPEAYLSLKALELQQKAVDAWDGRYPVYLMQGGEQGPNLLFAMPQIAEPPKATQERQVERSVEEFEVPFTPPGKVTARLEAADCRG